MSLFQPGGPARYAHQIAALRKVIETKGVCALLMDPGTGKSAVALDYASILALKTETEVRVLVLAPKVAIDSWVDHAAKFCAPGVEVWAEALGGSIADKAATLAARGPWSASQHDRAINTRKSPAILCRARDNVEVSYQHGPLVRPADGPRLIIEIVNYDAFASKAQLDSRRRAGITRQQAMIKGVRMFEPHLIVADESHVLRGPTSNTSKAIAKLTEVCPRRLMLTGTVMPHSPMNVFAQWRFMAPLAFGVRLADGSTRPATFPGFRDSYAVMGGWMGKQIVGFKRLDEMESTMALNAIVVRKQDALDLPPISDVRMPIDLSPAEHSAYEKMKNSLALQLADGTLATAVNPLAQMMKLRQITSGHLTDDAGAMRVLGETKVKAARQIVNDTLLGENRVVVFAHFRHEVAAVAAALANDKDAPGTVVEQISGDTSPEERILIRKRFGDTTANPERIVLVAQMRTMSLAVNELVTASHAVYLSLSERREDWVQSRDRLDRIGQIRPVTFWNVVVPGTIDEVMLHAHETRTNLEAAVLDHIRAA